MKAVYVIGGAGAGKSTFTQALLDGLGAELGPLEDLHALPNKKNVVTLRGHWTTDRAGLYLGVMRDRHPGTDGLDRASSPVGAEWLMNADFGLCESPRWLLGEGATLATRPFIGALCAHAELMVVHLRVDPVIADLRYLFRGTSQAEQFIKATRTRSTNMLAYVRELGAPAINIDTADPDAWDYGLDVCNDWIRSSS